MTGNQSVKSRWLVLVVMCTGYFLVLLDVTVVNIALPGIASSLGSSLAGLQWVVDGYAVALASLLLISGAVGDLRGHKRVVMFGLAVFGVASLGCGLSPTTAVLVVSRVVQGVGAALLLPGTLAIISRAFPQQAEQTRAIGIWAGVGSVALPAGPLLGGLVVQGVGWRCVFLINVPIVVCAAAVAARIVPRDSEPEQRRVDWAGAALGAITLAATTAAVIQAGHDGLSASAAFAAVVAVVALIAFLRVEAKSSDPMLPLTLFRDPAFGTANGAAGIMNFGTLGLLFLLTLFLQSVQHRSALVAGVAVLPLFLPLAALSPIAGRITARTGPKPVMSAGLLLAAVGVALLLLWMPTTTYPTLVPAMLLWGIGLGFLTPAVVAAAMGAVPQERSGLASGINNTARQAGGAIGIALYGAIAGQPQQVGRFVHGLHTSAVITAVLFTVAAAATAAFIPVRAACNARCGSGRSGREHVHPGLRA